MVEVLVEEDRIGWGRQVEEGTTGCDRQGEEGTTGCDPQTGAGDRSQHRVRLGGASAVMLRTSVLRSLAVLMGGG